jgi:TatD DNase family protein
MSFTAVIDTHAHLEYVLQQRGNTKPLDAFLPDSIEAVVCVFCDAAAVSSLGCFETLLENDRVFGAFGCHPRNAYSWTAKFRERVENALTHAKALAYGEMGLDYHHVSAQNSREVQISCFRDQLTRAVELGFPVCIHSRNAAADTFAILSELAPASHAIHLHCFDGDVEEAEKLLAFFSRLFIGFTGSLTHNNAHGEKLRLVCAAVPLERIVLETDAPYLAPQSNESAQRRKKHSRPSVPADVTLVAEAVARIKNLPLEQVVLACNANARELYGIPVFTSSSSSSSSSTAACAPPAPAVSESDPRSLSASSQTS